jgi:alpha-mannosidase
MWGAILILVWFCLVASSIFGADSQAPDSTDLYVVPNFHPGCMGWLVRYSEERNYCLYSYLAHLDRVAKDATYKFAFSEIPHLITMMELEPQRFEEFKQCVKEGRVEVVNAFVGEPTVNLSGGEALIQQGVQGLRWYKQIMNVKPRYCWMIDIVGWHEQMAQIVSGLGLEAFVYCRYNPTPIKSKRSHPIHWIQSPDGTRAVALGLGHYYRNFSKAFRSVGALTKEELLAEIESAGKKAKQFPAGAPVLLLGGSRDYSLPPNYENYPAELIEAWNSQASSLKIRMAALSDYMDVLLPPLRSGKYDIPVVTGGSRQYGWSAFWMNAPFHKQWYRRSEHRLQAAEAITTIAGLKGKMEYPSQDFANSWLLLALNMDRNLLWGVGVDGTFYDTESWDARDRFEYVDAVCARANQRAVSALTRKEESSVTLFNPVNWTRRTPFEIRLPQGQTLAEGNCQLLGDGRTSLAHVVLPSFSLSSMKLKWAGMRSPVKTTLPDRIDTTHYSAKIDPNTGALVSFKLKPSGREILGGPANVVLAESGGSVHWVPEKPKRSLLAGSSQYKPFITVTEGKLATVVHIRSNFYGGGELSRVLRFHKQSPRIDFLTETNNVPPGTTLSVEFPLAEQITEVRRGIPYGFSHGTWARKDSGLTGITKGIIPAIRWSHYSLAGGGGVALLDRGAPGRELVGNTPILLLHNVCDKYYNREVTWMNHKGSQTYEYALFVHEQPWRQTNIPQMAWEYNNPVVAMVGRSVSGRQSFIETSDNVIVQALRREDSEIELRMAECLGEAGPVRVKVNLPHTAAHLTDLLGRKLRLLDGGTEYTFEVRLQQVVTLRFGANDAVAPAEALRSFNSVIPPGKRKYMRNCRNPRLRGHPPTK